jgi:hypothetical protein
MSLVGIFTPGRTGSTLLLRLLDKLNNVYVHPTDIPFLSVYDDLNSFLVKNFRKTNFSSKSKKEIFLKKYYFSKDLFKFYKRDINFINKYYLKYSSEKEDVIYKDIFKKNQYEPFEFIEEYLKNFSAKLIGIKNPDTLIFRSIETVFLSNYRNLFPQLKFIHIIREPIEAYRSLVSSSRIKNSGVENTSFSLMGDNFEIFVEKRMKFHFDYLSKVKNIKTNDFNDLIIKYEDLLRKPKEVILIIERFLKKKFNNDFENLSILKNYNLKDLPKNIGGIDKITKKIGETPSLLQYNLKSNFFYNDLEIKEKKLVNLVLYKHLKEFNFNEDPIYKDIKTLIIDTLKVSCWEFSKLISKKNSLKKNIYNIFFCLFFFLKRRLKLIKYVKYFRELNK